MQAPYSITGNAMVLRRSDVLGVLVDQCGAKNEKIGCSRCCKCRTRACEVGVLPDILEADFATCIPTQRETIALGRSCVESRIPEIQSEYGRVELLFRVSHAYRPGAPISFRERVPCAVERVFG